MLYVLCGCSSNRLIFFCRAFACEAMRYYYITYYRDITRPTLYALQALCGLSVTPYCIVSKRQNIVQILSSTHNPLILVVSKVKCHLYSAFFGHLTEV